MLTPSASPGSPIESPGCLDGVEHPRRGEPGPRIAATAPPVRYVRERLGDLIHVDILKLPAIPPPAAGGSKAAAERPHRAAKLATAPGIERITETVRRGRPGDRGTSGPLRTSALCRFQRLPRPPRPKCGDPPVQNVERSEGPPVFGWSGVVAKTPLRGLGELALAMLASYVLT